MFKSEYQGGPFVEVFGAQGRDPLSKKCKVTGSSANIHKVYDKDVKSYVYVLEGEPTTTKIQFPKEDKQSLFLTQKFLVFQLFLPLGHPFSFEVAVSDHAQNKRRIFFSSNLKDISVTPLHARFPLTVLNLGSWLNLCLDLESLVSETFNGPKFRAVESFTVTANCRLKKVFTLKTPPVDTSDDQVRAVRYANSEPLPRNLQLMTTSRVSTVTQILSYGKLCSKAHENPTTPLSTPSGHEGSTPRHDQETHIAFGTKVLIPAHVRKNSLKENRENISTKIPYSRQSSSKSKHGHSTSDIRNTLDESAKGKEKNPLTPKGNLGTQGGGESGTPKGNLGTQSGSESGPKGIDANQAIIQPRPPRTSSAGKIRRPIRLKASSAGKPRTNEKTGNANDKQPNGFENEANRESNIHKSLDDLNREPLKNPDTGKLVKSSLKSTDKSLANDKLENRPDGGDLRDNCESEIRKLASNRADIDELQNFLCNKQVVSSSIQNAENVNTKSDVSNEKASMKISYNVDVRSPEGVTNLGEPTSTSSEGLRRLIDDEIAAEIARSSINSAKSVNKTEIDTQTPKQGIANPNLTRADNLSAQLSNGADLATANGLENKSKDEQSFDNVSSEQDAKVSDVNNNDQQSMDNSVDQRRPKPRMLPLASNNPVFTFASMPRSPRSGKRKVLGSPVVDDVTPSVEAAPEVMVSLAEDALLKNGGRAGRNGGQSQRNKGASLEDDFCKLSDEEYEEDGDGIQKLLQSSLSPRHSPMPFEHHLRQSIRSSMLKEIPSPVKENGYDAQNYQSDDHMATLNQSAASSWRFDTSDSSVSFNHTHQDLEDSLNNSNSPKQARRITAIADVPVVDENDEDAHSDCSDETSYSTWRAPPQDLRGNKYQNEMKPPGHETDLTATMPDPRDYCDVFSPPIILGTPSKESNDAILAALKSPQKLKSPAVNHERVEEEEEELDLLYDPVLNCYFDPKTHKYYELA